MHRFPSKMNALQQLVDFDVSFGSIIDVGTHAEIPELRQVFPHNRHVLFEPASEFFPRIAANYAGLNWELIPVAVSDTDGEGSLRKSSIDGSEISHSKLEASMTPDLALREGDLDVCRVRTVRLDTFFKTRNEPKPYLLKIDVDGFEIPILRGAEGILDDVDCIVIEATMDTFFERFEFIARRGFQLFDIVDQCYYGGVFSQADLVFVSNRLRKSNPRLRPWETESFAWEKWVPVANYETFVPKAEEVQK